MFQMASFMVWRGSDRNAVSLCTGRGGLAMCWARVARMSCDGHEIDMVLSPQPISHFVTHQSIPPHSSPTLLFVTNRKGVFHDHHLLYPLRD